MPNNTQESQLTIEESRALVKQICRAACRNDRNELSSLHEKHGSFDITTTLNEQSETPASLLIATKNLKALSTLLDYNPDIQQVARQCVAHKFQDGIKLLIERDLISLAHLGQIYAEYGDELRANILRDSGVSFKWIIRGYAIGGHLDKITPDSLALPQNAAISKTLQAQMIYARARKGEMKEPLSTSLGSDALKQAVAGFTEAGDDKQADQLLTDAKNNPDLYRQLRRQRVYSLAKVNNSVALNQLLDEKDIPEEDIELKLQAVTGFAETGNDKAIERLLQSASETDLYQSLYLKAIYAYAKMGYSQKIDAMNTTHEQVSERVMSQEENYLLIMKTRKQAMRGYAAGGYQEKAKALFVTCQKLEPNQRQRLLSDLLCASAIEGHYAQTAGFFRMYSQDEKKYAELIARAYADGHHILELRSWMTEQHLPDDSLEEQCRPIGNDEMSLRQLSEFPFEFYLFWYFSNEPDIYKAVNLLEKVNTINLRERVTNFFYCRNEPRQEIQEICQQVNRVKLSITRWTLDIDKMMNQLAVLALQFASTSKIAQCIAFIDKQINSNAPSEESKLEERAHSHRRRSS